MEEHDTVYRLSPLLNIYTKLDQRLFHALPGGYARAAYVKANFLLFRKLQLAWPVEIETRHRLRMIVDKVDRIAGYIYYFHVWEPQISVVLTQLLQPGDTVLDVGAHIGHHTLLAAKLVGASGRVYAFEASPQTFAALKTNIALNRLAQVDARNFAVCGDSGFINLFVAPYEDSGRNSLNERKGWHSIAVPCTRLDTLLDEICPSTIRFIKIDVEGAEREVLAGAGELLTRLPDDVAILIEVQTGSSDDRVDSQGILNFLMKCGFSAYSVNNRYSATKYDAPADLTPVVSLRKHSMTDVLFVRGRLIDRISKLVRSLDCSDRARFD
jgi:FkbM family methyltransferase